MSDITSITDDDGRGRKLPNAEILRRQLREAEKVEAAEKEQRLRENPVKWLYTISRKKTDSWNEVFDDTCILYELSGIVTNRTESAEIGHPDYSMKNGSMCYLFNTITGKIVMAVGGGTMYVSGKHPGETEHTDHITAFSEINEFLTEHPNGGDITHIVLKYQNARKEARTKKNA